MRRRNVRIALAACVGIVTGPTNGADETPSPWTLWYDEPAERWVEALPLGSGRLGAMVFGGVQAEHLQLNEDTIWAGRPLDRERRGAREHLDEARRLLFEGRFVEGQRIMQERFMSERLVRSYQTLGDVHVRFATLPSLREGLGEGDTQLRQAPGAGPQVNERALPRPLPEGGGYARSLDLDTGIARVEYEGAGATFTREVFASAVDQVIVARFSSTEPGRITAEIELSRPVDATVHTVGDDRLVMRGRATHDGAHAGVNFAAHLHARAEGGAIEATGSTLRVTDADALVLVLSAGSDYGGGDPSVVSRERLEPALARTWADLRARHVAEHQRLFRRVDLDLGHAEGEDRPTDERLAGMREGAADPELVALYFQFGRYLLMSCSRPGCMPANLQGLWSHHIAAPWNADYHININVQMNYWPAEVCNLSECHEPFFDLVDGIRARGRKTARELYGCAGWMAHHTTDAWWFTVPIGRTVWGLWPTGGAWCTRHLWEHYLFTGDREFLAQRAYPVMTEAAAFFLDYLVEDPQTGALVSGPASSPENTFRTPDGARADTSMGPVMDQQIIWDLFTNLAEAEAVIGAPDPDSQRRSAALSRLAKPRTGSDGRLLEWSRPFEEAEPGHRHMSHLFALHPGRQITPDGTPRLAAAARRSLEHRLEHGGGHTGWSRAWMINFWARLHDGDRAYDNVLALLRASTLPNLFDNHPPFQIDGNFGGTAGIAEMLIQSHAGEIHLLPALPAAWPDGSVRGLCARGALIVDIEWADGRLSRARLHGRAGRTDDWCVVRYGQRTLRREVTAGATMTLDVAAFDGQGRNGRQNGALSP